MTREQLRSIQAKLPLSAATLARNQADDSGSGPRSVVQKQPGAVPDKPAKPGMDGVVPRPFRVTVVLRVSDRRRRDADGGLSTLLDCICRAARRFSGLDS